MKDSYCSLKNVQTVAIIGNGPSAIYMSFFLSGNLPSYNGTPHPNESLQQRLFNMDGTSLLQQDLEMLSSGIEGRRANQISVLFDSLSNPYADFGMDSQSLLSWHFKPDSKISHVVIGKGRPGGAWQTMEREIKSLSLSFLLQLPGMNFSDWLKSFRSSNKSELKVDETRANVDEVCKYFEDFISRRGLEENFLNHHTVQSIRKVPFDLNQLFDDSEGSDDIGGVDEGGGGSCDENRKLYDNDDDDDDSYLNGMSNDNKNTDADFQLKKKLLKKRDFIWEICGTNAEGKEFFIKAINLVLATGASDCPNKLGVKGECLPYVLHSHSEFDHIIKMKKCCRRPCRLRRNVYNFFRICNSPLPSPYFEEPVVIIGSGLSAADAVLYALDRQIPICHIFKSDYNAVDKLYSSLSTVTYPEYVKVYNLMKGKILLSDRYKCFPGANVLGFTDDHQVMIQECDKEDTTYIRASMVVVLIGSRPDLSFLGEELTKTLYRKSRPNNEASSGLLVDIDPLTYESRNHKGLYAMGPLVGDNFVRFLGGGALAISSHINKTLSL